MSVWIPFYVSVYAHGTSTGVSMGTILCHISVYAHGTSTGVSVRVPFYVSVAVRRTSTGVMSVWLYVGPVQVCQGHARQGSWRWRQLQHSSAVGQR